MQIEHTRGVCEKGNYLALDGNAMLVYLLLKASRRTMRFSALGAETVAASSW
jgi:hypothetical protein